MEKEKRELRRELRKLKKDKINREEYVSKRRKHESSMKERGRNTKKKKKIR